MFASIVESDFGENVSSVKSLYTLLTMISIWHLTNEKIFLSQMIFGCSIGSQFYGCNLERALSKGAESNVTHNTISRLINHNKIIENSTDGLASGAA